MENSIQIAWDYLERTGEIDDGVFACGFLDAVEDMIRHGERSRLLRSNKAITAYQRRTEAIISVASQIVSGNTLRTLRALSPIKPCLPTTQTPYGRQGYSFHLPRNVEHDR